MGPLLRMQTNLHFEDLPENEQVQYLHKIAIAENPSGHYSRQCLALKKLD